MTFVYRNIQVATVAIDCIQFRKGISVLVRGSYITDKLCDHRIWLYLKNFRAAVLLDFNRFKLSCLHELWNQFCQTVSQYSLQKSQRHIFQKNILGVLWWKCFPWSFQADSFRFFSIIYYSVDCWFPFSSISDTLKLSNLWYFLLFFKTFTTVCLCKSCTDRMEQWRDWLTLKAPPTPQNGQAHSNNSPVINFSVLLEIDSPILHLGKKTFFQNRCHNHLQTCIRQIL